MNAKSLEIGRGGGFSPVRRAVLLLPFALAATKLLPPANSVSAETVDAPSVFDKLMNPFIAAAEQRRAGWQNDPGYSRMKKKRLIHMKLAPIPFFLTTLAGVW